MKQKSLLKILALLALLLSSALPMAAESVNALVVELKDGTKMTFVLQEKPEVKFAGPELKVVSETSETSFPLGDVLRFSYSKADWDGIAAAEAKRGVTMEDGVLVLSQLRKNAKVGVYATDGKLVKDLTAPNEGTYRLNLSSLTKGVYLVKVDKVTYKIRKQ